MGVFTSIFNKKYDKFKDNLVWKFDYVSKSWQLLKDGEVVDVNKLNKATKKELANRNEDLKNERILNTLLRLHDPNYQLTKEELRIRKLESLGYRFRSFETLIVKNEGTMSKELEELLNSLLEKDVLLGIHRVGPSGSLDIVEDVICNGLIMTGDIERGAFSNEVDLSINVSYYRDNGTIIKELMYAKTYKDSMGSYLISIPIEDLEKDIYIKNEKINQVRLDPKYIVGYIPVDDNRHIENIITKENIKKYKKNEVINQEFENVYNQMVNTSLEEDDNNKTL